MKKIYQFCRFFSISDNIFFNNIQVSLKKIFLLLRTLFVHYIISQIITCEVSIVKNLLYTSENNAEATFKSLHYFSSHRGRK